MLESLAKLYNIFANTNRRILQWKVHYFFKKYMFLAGVILVNN